MSVSTSHSRGIAARAVDCGSLVPGSRETTSGYRAVPPFRDTRHGVEELIAFEDPVFEEIAHTPRTVSEKLSRVELSDLLRQYQYRQPDIVLSHLQSSTKALVREWTPDELLTGSIHSEYSLRYECSHGPAWPP
jgi:hypothetical protein